MLTKKNKCCLLLLIILITNNTFAQNVGINSTGAAPNASAMLDIANTTKGLLIPRVSLVTSNNNSPIGAGIATSLLVYNIATAGVTPNNVLPGYYYWNGSKWVAFGGQGSLNWGLQGNAGTVDGTNFIGTTDSVSLSFRVNNQKSGIIDLDYKNTFLGYKSGKSATIGERNTAFGYQALSFNLLGGENTAVGYKALYSNIGITYADESYSGNQNTAIGSEAMYNNTLGYWNTAIGHQPLFTNISGFSNIAIGDSPLYFNTSGYGNIGIGSSALRKNTIGVENIGIGNNALNNNINGDNNIAIGGYALSTNTTGIKNIAIGNNALSSLTIGKFNCAIGENTLFGVVTTSNNIAIGYNAAVPIVTNNNQIRMGNALITYAGSQVAWTITSDKRWKSEIKNSNLGLDFIKALKPVYYIRNNDENKKTEYGFIAQEVEELLTKFGCTSNGIISKDDAGMLGMRYNDLIAITVKAMQEQQVVIDNQNLKIKTLEERLIILETKLK